MKQLTPLATRLTLWLRFPLQSGCCLWRIRRLHVGIPSTASCCLIQALRPVNVVGSQLTWLQAAGRARLLVVLYDDLNTSLTDRFLLCRRRRPSDTWFEVDNASSFVSWRASKCDDVAAATAAHFAALRRIYRPLLHMKWSSQQWLLHALWNAFVATWLIMARICSPTSQQASTTSLVMFGATAFKWTRWR